MKRTLLSLVAVANRTRGTFEARVPRPAADGSTPGSLDWR